MRQRFKKILTAHFLQHFKEKQRVCHKRKNKEILAGNASLVLFFFCCELVCIQHWQPTGRLNEWGRCTTHSQSRTCTHWRTNAAPSFYRPRGEEGEYLNAWSFSQFFFCCFSPNRVLIWAQLKSTVELRASKAVFIWHSADFTATARVVPPRVTEQCIPCCWNSTLPNILLQGIDQTQ